MFSEIHDTANWGGFTPRFPNLSWRQRTGRVSLFGWYARTLRAKSSENEHNLAGIWQTILTTFRCEE